MIHKIKVAKYDPLNNAEEARDTIIEITEKIPPLWSDLERAKEFYESEASKLAEALCNGLPQGTLHQLVIKLLQSYTTLYRGKVGT